MTLIQINDCENESLGIIDLSQSETTAHKIEIAWNDYVNEFYEDLDDFIEFYNVRHENKIERVFLENIYTK
jgi:hypothetical protein